MAMKNTKPIRYAVCIKNEGYSVSLDLRKLYKVVAHEPNDPDSMIRVVDESGEDYLYPKSWFIAVTLPTKAKRAVAAAR